jgi:hypothetical protein
MREVGYEIRDCNELIPNRVECVHRNRSLDPTIRADQVDVIVLVNVVILGASPDVSVRQHSHLFQKLDRSIHRRGVYAGLALPDAIGYLRGHDVTAATHDLQHDRPSLLGHPVATLPDQVEHILCVRSRVQVGRRTLDMAGRSMIS